jgi:hypothetical protein
VIVDAGFFNEWSIKGHRYGQCMVHPDGNLMYVNIPKNASSWTKPNLLDFNWKDSNYYDCQLNAHALVVLRDPVDRWVSGIAEYFALYHTNFNTWTSNIFDLVFERVCFDDHTELQVKFIHGLDTSKCTFLMCDANYRSRFSSIIQEYHGNNNYNKYAYQHVSEQDPVRKEFKKIFKDAISEPKYLSQIKNYFEADYHLINSVKFYEPRQLNR